MGHLEINLDPLIWRSLVLLKIVQYFMGQMTLTATFIILRYFTITLVVISGDLWWFSCSGFIVVCGGSVMVVLWWFVVVLWWFIVVRGGSVMVVLWWFIVVCGSSVMVVCGGSVVVVLWWFVVVL